MKQHLTRRPRRLRNNAVIRDLVAETHLRADDFIVPFFIEEGQGIIRSIESMPNYNRYSIDKLLEKIDGLYALGLRTYLLFVKAAEELKDNKGTEALNDEGLMQRSVRAVKERYPDCVVMTDVALDPFSSYGHDGIVEGEEIMNDPTVAVLAQMALSHARAGADIIAPSDMMDGRIGAIRATLDAHDFEKTGILSYAAKYASAWYGPFRNALDSAPGFGDKSTYQMDIRNAAEALEECALDYEEGADIVMVKPAANYLDVIHLVRSNFNIPVAAYQVSGEYSMMHASAEKGWIDLEKAMMESLTAIKRAGADMIATYFAEDMVKILRAGG